MPRAFYSWGGGSSVGQAVLRFEKGCSLAIGAILGGDMESGLARYIRQVCSLFLGLSGLASWLLKHRPGVLAPP